MRRSAVLTVLALVPMPMSGLAGPTETQPEQGVHHVHLLSTPIFHFDPPVVQARPGDVIAFHSHDLQHTATSGLATETEPAEGAAPADLQLNAFNTGTILGGTTASVTLQAPGAYPYYCAVGFHRLLFMHGAILVNSA